MSQHPKRKNQLTPLAAATAAPVGDHLFFYLFQVEYALRTGIEERLQALDLDLRQFSTLAFIVDGQAPTQHELAQLLRLDPSQVVTLTKGLAERQLLVRSILESDRRAKVLSITVEGRRLYAQAAVAIRRVEDNLTASLSRRDHTALQSLLHRILPPV